MPRPNDHGRKNENNTTTMVATGCRSSRRIQFGATQVACDINPGAKVGRKGWTAPTELGVPNERSP